MPEQTPYPQNQNQHVGAGPTPQQPYIPVMPTIAIPGLPLVTQVPDDALFMVQVDGMTKSITALDFVNTILISQVTSVNTLIGAVQIGLYNLTDTRITDPQVNDTIIFNGQYWVNASLNPYPDITDSNGLVTITGNSGLQVNNALNVFGAATFNNNAVRRPQVTNTAPSQVLADIAIINDLDLLTLNGLHDVSVSSNLPNNSMLVWDTNIQRWRNVLYDPTPVPSMLWTPSGLTTGYYSSVCLKSNALVLAIASKSNGGILWSEDGKTVTQSNIATGNFYKIVNLGAVMIACGDTGVYSSPDGKVWTISNITVKTNKLIVSATTALAFLDNGGVRRSVNGSTWAATSITTGTYVSGDYQPNTTSSQTNWLIGGNLLGAYSQDDGLTWTSVTTTQQVNDIAYITASTFAIATSTGLYTALTADLTWQLKLGGNFTSITYTAGLALITRANDVPVYTTNGVLFNNVNGITSASPLNFTAFGNGYWVGGGQDTGLWWSVDGKEWALSNQTSGSFSGAGYGSGVWVALGNPTGPQGIFWSSNTAGRVWSVNGQTGVVYLGLGDLGGVRITNPQNGDGLIYQNGFWVNTGVDNYPNLISSGIGLATTLTYSGTGGLVVTNGLSANDITSTTTTKSNSFISTIAGVNKLSLSSSGNLFSMIPASLTSALDINLTNSSVNIPNQLTVPNLAITDNSQNAANTKYVHDTINNGAANFVVATGVPTFQAGEEYIIAVGLLDGEVMINLSLLAGWQSGSTGYNQYDVVSVLGFESSVAFPQASVQIVSNSLPVEYFSIMLYALDYPVTVNNITLPAGSSVFTVKLLQSIPATGTINSSKGSYLSASKDFINQVSSNNYPVLFEPVAPGVLSAASNWFRSVTYQTKANLESPIFVGAPTAPTQPKGSNNATLATMAAITQALGDYTSTVNLQNGSFSPTLNNCSAKSLTVNSSSNTALLSLTQSSANVVSVIPQGLTSALDIDITTKGISIPFQITVPNLATSDNSQKAANTKFVVDYVAATPSGGGIVASGGSGKNRWVKFAPDGNGNQLIMQFGSYSVAANTVVTFPTSFATTNYSVAISTASGTGNGARLSSWNYTNSSSMTCTGVMYIQTTGNTTPASDDGTYIAIGY